jgi:hypothetical protein
MEASMRGYKNGDMEARKFVEQRWPQKPISPPKADVEEVKLAKSPAPKDASDRPTQEPG